MTDHPLARYLPHRPPMILLDELVACNATTIDTAATIRDESMFYDPALGGIPVHVGIEYMAQTCGVFAGLRALASGGRVRVGFLLGSRNYKAVVPKFATGWRLIVSARQELADENMWSFHCSIRKEDSMLAMARLNLFQLDDPAGFRRPEQGGIP